MTSDYRSCVPGYLSAMVVEHRLRCYAVRRSRTQTLQAWPSRLMLNRQSNPCANTFWAGREEALGRQTDRKNGAWRQAPVAKATRPTGWHHANMWAPPETRIRDKRAFTCRWRQSYAYEQYTKVFSGKILRC